MGELGVGGNTNDLGVDTSELLERGVEGEDLSGADDCRCERGGRQVIDRTKGGQAISKIERERGVVS